MGELQIHNPGKLLSVINRFAYLTLPSLRFASTPDTIFGPSYSKVETTTTFIGILHFSYITAMIQQCIELRTVFHVIDDN